MAAGSPVQVCQYLSTANVASGTATVATASPAGAGLVVAVVASIPINGSQQAFTVSDTQGNTYTAVGPPSAQNGVAAASAVQMFLCPNAKALATSDSVTVTNPSSSNNQSLGFHVAQLPGIASSSPVDGTPVTGSGTTGTMNLPALPAHAGGIVLGLFSYTGGSGATFAAGSGFTQQAFAKTTTSNPRSLALMYAKVAADGSITPAATDSGAGSPAWSGQAVAILQGAPTSSSPTIIGQVAGSSSTAPAGTISPASSSSPTIAGQVAGSTSTAPAGTVSPAVPTRYDGANSFDGGGVAFDASSSNPSTVDATAGRTGQGLDVNVNNAVQRNSWDDRTFDPSAIGKRYWALSFWFRLPTPTPQSGNLGGTSAGIATVKNSTTATGTGQGHFDFFYNPSDGTLHWDLLAASYGQFAVAADTWYYVQARGDFGSPTYTADITINGQAQTSIASSGMTPYNAKRFSFGSDSANQAYRYYVDDVQFAADTQPVALLGTPPSSPTITGQPATSASTAPAGQVSPQQVPTLTGPTAASTSTAPAGSTAPSTLPSIAGQTAASTSTAPAGQVAAAQTPQLAGPTAQTASAAPPGTVAPVATPHVAGPTATATSSSPAGTVTVVVTPSLAGTTARSASTAPAGSVSTSAIPAISAPTAVTLSTAPAGTCNPAQQPYVTGQTATSTATAIPGTVTVTSTPVLAGPTAISVSAAPAGHVDTVRPRDITITATSGLDRWATSSPADRWATSIPEGDSMGRPVAVSAGAEEFRWITITETSGKDITADLVYVALASTTDARQPPAAALFGPPDELVRDPGRPDQVTAGLLITGGLLPVGSQGRLWGRISDNPEAVAVASPEYIQTI